MSPAPALRIMFAGTPDFAVPSLRRLIDEHFPPIAILTQPDRPAGRGRQTQTSPVKRAATTAGIPVHQPATLRGPEVAGWLTALQPDLMVVVAYGLIVPPAVLTVPRHGCWNIHASLLPRWRGAAPIQRAIEAGDSKTGVCIMQMDTGLDTGDVLLCRETPIAPDDTGGTLHDRLSGLGADLLLEAVHALARGCPPEPTPQPRAGVTYAAKLDKSEARIAWRDDAASIARRVRAFNPWPVAWCDIGGERTRIWSASPEPGAAGAPPGTVLEPGATGIRVATGRGVLVLERLQRPGGRPVSAADYLNAQTLPACLAEAG